MSWQQKFDKLARKVSALTGSAWVFVLAVVSILLWLALGPWYGFDEAWNFWANSSTTVVTFLLVFLIQNTQNRDAEAIHLKLDELIRAIPQADDGVKGIEKVDP